MDPAAYLQTQNKTREEVIEESMPDAAADLRREAVLAAIVEAEEIEVSEDEMLDAAASERLPTSRLSCQIELSDELDGLVVRLPETQL